MREQDELDSLLDSALASYADPGPEAGLEQRILHSLSGARPELRKERARRPKWLGWAVGLPAAACLLVLWLVESKPGHLPMAPPVAYEAAPGESAAAPRQSAPTAATRPVQRVRHSPAAHPAAQLAHANPPKLEVFPTPQPLTEQERALVAVTAQTPSPARAALVKAQQQTQQPIRIAAIAIPPLQSLIPDQH